MELHQIKIRSSDCAIVDATIIRSAGSKLKKSVEVQEDGNIVDTPASKDAEARWTIKDSSRHLGFKGHIQTDAGGFVEQVAVTPANAADVNHFECFSDKIKEGRKVFADKGYDSKHNREELKNRELKDGIMKKSHRNQPLTREDIERNKQLSKTRYVIEQTFAILHRRFRCKRASYFGVAKVRGQMLLKSMCLNLLKAANKIRINAPSFA